MNIIDAIKHENILRPYFGKELRTWFMWLVVLRALYGLPTTSRSGRALVRQCMGRDAAALPPSGFDIALLLTGRRCGKSRMAAVVGAYEALLGGHEKRLAPGEQGLVTVMSPTLKQSRVVKGYIRAVFNTPTLAKELVKEDKEGFVLRNGIRIEPLVADWRTVRGFTLVAAIVDEACFLGVEADAKVKNDTELIAALEPALATTGGKLICISTPYAKRGWCYETYKANYGNPVGDVLVWNCPSRVMNPTLPQAVVDRALRKDKAKAEAEYLGKWRDDVAAYLPREAVEAVVKANRKELMCRPGTAYFAFVDISGGRADDGAVAVAHKEGTTVVVDCLVQYKPPFDPAEVCGRMAAVVKRYGCRRVVGDRYGAEFTVQAFNRHGIQCTPTDKSKSELYLELLPRIGSQEIELLDNPVLVDQLADLERRTRSGGRDIIDHPANGHDDLANVVAGVATVACTQRLRAGALRRTEDRRRRLVG